MRKSFSFFLSLLALTLLVSTKTMAIGAITGADSVCAGTTTTMADTTAGGTWSTSSSTIATINSSGVVYAVSAGTVTISYVTTGTGGGVATRTLVVKATPAAISGSATAVCTGSTITFSDATTGGTWSSSATYTFTVSATGTGTTATVGGVSVGTGTLSYTVSGCSAYAYITVIAAPIAGTISGDTVLCVGGTGHFTTSGASGTGNWSSSDASIESIGAGTGVSTARAVGTVTISYTVSSSCGSAVSTFSTRVASGSTPSAGTITGTATICPGANDTFTAVGATSGGTWTSSATSVATIGSTSGIARGVAPGTTTITYSVSSACATVYTTYPLTVGSGGSAGTIGGPTTICVGYTGTMTSTVTGGTWTITPTAVATVNASTGVVTGVSAGSATVTYTVTGSCGTTSTTRPLSIPGAPSSGYIVGPTSVCVSSSITLRDSAGTAGGYWLSSNPSRASVNSSGIVTGNSAGTVTITYYVTSSCGGSGYVSSTYTITVLSRPAVSPISGPSTVCIGSPITLSDTASGGTWTSRNTSIATVGATTGVVSGVASGNDTIVYAVTNTCGTASTFKIVTVSAAPTIGAISGASSVCAGSNITLTDTTSGGTWTSSNTSVATVAGGVVTGRAGGSVNITYSKTYSCGTVYVTKAITVNPLPTTSRITGPASICRTSGSVTYTDSVSGGTWSSSSPTVVTINSSTGVAIGTNVGSATITYTTSNSCGTSQALINVTVVNTPSAGTIVGPLSSVCTGSTINFYDTTASAAGTWSSSNSSIASVNTGLVRGNGVGTATISYSVTNACGTAVATHSVLVTISASAGTVNGPVQVCAGSTISLNDTTSTSLGSWSSSDISIATVNASGVVYGVSSGSVTISYSVSGTCGSASATKSITVLTASAGSISGPTSVCIGNTVSLSDAISGGTWTSGSPSVATVNASTGVVTGVATGTAIITYTVTNICGTAYTIYTMSVGTPPAAPAAITGPATVCVGSTITLSDATTGGTWGIFNTSLASIGATTGIVTGVAPGRDTVKYSVTNTCGSTTVTYVINIITVPATPAAIAGSNSVCTGSSVTLTDATTGGVWYSGNLAVATVSPTGVVTGISGGTTTISYTVTNTCGATSATMSFTVNPAPTAGVVSGASTVCTGTSTTFTSTVTGGTWSSANSAIASVSTSGVVYGVASGTTTIDYTVVGTCGTATATRSIVVNPGPTNGPITGLSSVCPGATIALADTTLGGVWTSSDSTIASVNAVGVVTGMAPGTVTISYTTTNSCGAISNTKSITVNPGSYAGIISGASILCVGSSSTLSSTVAGGTWTSSNPAAVTISASTGSMTALTTGSATITYTTSSVCGSAVAGYVVSVGSLPVSGTISGPTGLCAGTTITLSTTGTGGSWVSSNTTLATVSAAGVVTGVAGGSVTISYVVSSSCATSTSTYSITISPAGTAGTLSGLATVCPGANITLTTSGATGGTWSSSNTARATVSSTGVVYGVSVGSLVISYAISNSCGTTTATKTITVNPLPYVSVLSGPSAVCVGSTITLTDSVTGTGTAWLSSNTAIATVASGVVRGVAAGTAIITFYQTNSCGTARTTKSVTVSTLSAGVITGSTTVAVGRVITLSASITGGTWSSVYTSLATVSTAGAVTGVAVGTDTIKYAVTNACGTAIARYTVNVTATRPAIESNSSDEDLKLYPNPTTGSFMIEFAGQPSNTIVRIFDMSGKMVGEMEGSEKVMNFDVSNYASGTYLVRIETGENVISRKLIIQ